MTGGVDQVRHFIAGKEESSISGRTFASINPSTGAHLAEVSFGEREDVDRAVAAAWHAHESGVWSNVAPMMRARCLRRIADLIRERTDEIAQIDTLDAGKPIGDSRADVEAAAAMLDYASTLPENSRGVVFPQERGYVTYSTREPYGVVGAIAPWNFPFLLAVAKTAPALAVGNSVVLKMAEQTPLSTSTFARLCAEAGVPAGILNVVHGDGPTTGAALAAHPRVPKLTFTGSTTTGRRILSAAVDSIKSCHLELGGKTPNIVLADADLDQAIAGSLFTSFWNTGQVCTSGSRLLVDERIADEFIATLTKRARTLRVGDPLDPQTHLGPLVSQRQFERVTSFVSQGLDAGAKVVTGGEVARLLPPHNAGFFVQPTIFDDVDPTMTIAQHEIFGPVLSVLRFRSLSEAIALANDVAYGLAATVWTRSLEDAFRCARELDAGVIWTNCPHTLGWHVPYEGHKQSGIGEDQGLESIATFTKLKVHNVNFEGSRLAWGAPQ